MGRHVMEALGMSRVVMEDGKVIEVSEPRVKYCPLFKKHRNIDELNKEVAAQICDKLRTIINLKVAEQRARELIAAGKVTVPAAVSTDAEVGTDA